MNRVTVAILVALGAVGGGVGGLLLSVFLQRALADDPCASASGACAGFQPNAAHAYAAAVIGAIIGGLLVRWLTRRGVRARDRSGKPEPTSSRSRL